MAHNNIIIPPQLPIFFLLLYPIQHTPPNTTAEVVYRTPTADKESSRKIKPKHGLYERKVVLEMERCYCKINYDKFMSLFAKVEGLGHPELSKKQLASMLTKFKDVPESGKEQEMYAPLCKSLNEALAQAVTFAASQGASNATAHTTNLAISSAPDAQTTKVAPPTPPYVFKDVSSWIESNEHDLKIDIAMYPDTEDARAAFTRDMEKTARTDVARVAWAWMTMGVEVKRDEAESAFDFGRPSLLRDSDNGRVAQAQIAKYATQLMLRQHRAFVFILYIVDKEAFLTRWGAAYN
ncbi:hypothetical protein BC835DRAFT_1412286 [Cytidiella melzeri]|nr:hypothetical protein BC835DRAFT_1412286 [Cytidiella melzeri]